MHNSHMNDDLTLGKKTFISLQVFDKQTTNIGKFLTASLYDWVQLKEERTKKRNY